LVCRRRISRQEARDQEYYISSSDAANSSEGEDLDHLQASEDDLEHEADFVLEKRGRGRPRGRGKGRGRPIGIQTGDKAIARAPLGIEQRQTNMVHSLRVAVQVRIHDILELA
jgi:hypothetical protein